MIQDAFTCLQVAEERGRFYDEDDEDDEDYFYYDDYADDSSMRDLFEQMLFGRMGGFAGFGGFGPRDYYYEECQGAARGGPCNCPDCVFERQQQTRQRKDDEFRRAYRARQERASEIRKQEQAEKRRKNEETFRNAQERARKEGESARSGASSKSEQLRERGNNAFREGAYARAATQYSAALKALGAANADATLLSNRSAAYSKLERFDMALADADAAVKLLGAWDKAHARRATALAGLGKEEEAAKAFEAAAACCEAAGERDGYREMAAAQRAAPRRSSARPRRRGSRRSRPTCAARPRRRGATRRSRRGATRSSLS